MEFDWEKYRQFRKIEIGNAWLVNLLVVICEICLLIAPIKMAEAGSPLISWQLFFIDGALAFAGASFIKKQIKKHIGFDILPQDTVTKKRWRIDNSAIWLMIVGYVIGVLYMVVGAAGFVAMIRMAFFGK